jgi:hypothetical protein
MVLFCLGLHCAILLLAWRLENSGHPSADQAQARPYVRQSFLNDPTSSTSLGPVSAFHSFPHNLALLFWDAIYAWFPSHADSWSEALNHPEIGGQFELGAIQGIRFGPFDLCMCAKLNSHGAPIDIQNRIFA